MYSSKLACHILLHPLFTMKLTSNSSARFEGKFPPKVEDEGKELLPRVQRLEDELKGSKQNMIKLIHGNRALQYELKAIRKEEGHIHQELASLKETLLPLLNSQVSMVVLRHQTYHQECCV